MINHGPLELPLVCVVRPGVSEQDSGTLIPCVPERGASTKIQTVPNAQEVTVHFLRGKRARLHRKSSLFPATSTAFNNH